MTSPAIQAPPAANWRHLDQSALTPAEQAIYDRATRPLLGPLAWQRRKAIELHDALVLARLSNRYQITAADVRGDFNLVVQMDVTVPVMPPGMVEPVISRGAILAISYKEEALYSAQPGTHYATVVLPAHDTFHPYIHPNFQTICLGTVIPPAFPVKELIFRLYLALTMTGIHLDPGDGAGVLNARAANFWVQQPPHRLPLMSEPFFKASAAGGKE